MKNRQEKPQAGTERDLFVYRDIKKDSRLRKYKSAGTKKNSSAYHCGNSLLHQRQASGIRRSRARRKHCSPAYTFGPGKGKYKGGIQQQRNNIHFTLFDLGRPWTVPLLKTIVQPEYINPRIKTCPRGSGDNSRRPQWGLREDRAPLLFRHPRVRQSSREDRNAHRRDAISSAAAGGGSRQSTEKYRQNQ